MIRSGDGDLPVRSRFGGGRLDQKLFPFDTQPEGYTNYQEPNPRVTGGFLFGGLSPRLAQRAHRQIRNQPSLRSKSLFWTSAKFLRQKLGLFPESSPIIIMSSQSASDFSQTLF
jgi:hypothetical protein